jgi:hypothetical protein
MHQVPFPTAPVCPVTDRASPSLSSPDGSDRTTTFCPPATCVSYSIALIPSTIELCEAKSLSPSRAPHSPSRSMVASAHVVPLLRHRQATAPSGRATTEAVVHAFLLHLHESCHTQATVQHKLRLKHADVVYLSDGRPPLTAFDPTVAATRSAPTSRCTTTSVLVPSTTSPAYRQWCPFTRTCRRGGAVVVSSFLPKPLKPVHRLAVAL